jgi:hypothetical protein
MGRKPRIFYLAWTPPAQGGGATLAMYRHFIQHRDFDLFVATDGNFQEPDIPSLRLERPAWIRRVGRTRLSRWVRQFEMVVESAWVPSAITRAVASFQPDAIFTVADNTLSWTAAKVARTNNLPLLINFQDWWPRGQFVLDLEKPFPPVAALLERRFHQMYRDSAVAFCTSAGMREKLGLHPNAPVLYPCSAPRDSACAPNFVAPNGSKPLKLIYAGTVFRDYGKSVLRLARALAGLPWIEFEVYGPHPDWSEADLAWMKSHGIYRGLLSHDDLKSRLRAADACLVVMSFGRDLELMMRTSFTTKFLEYVQFAKPVIVWGPDYCQPVRVAQETGAGLAVIEDEVNVVIEALETLRQPEIWTKCARGSWAAANDGFSHERIHEIFRGAIYSALSGKISRENEKNQPEMIRP